MIRLVGTKRGRFYLFGPADVLCLELRSGLVHAVLTTGETYVMEGSVRGLAERLAPCGFVRIHRDIIVNLRHVVEMGREEAGCLSLLLRAGAVTRDVMASRPASARLRRRLGLPGGHARPEAPAPTTTNGGVRRERREFETKRRDLEDRFARLLGGDGPLEPQHEKGCTGACRFCVRAALTRVEAS